MSRILMAAALCVALVDARQLHHPSRRLLDSSEDDIATKATVYTGAACKQSNSGSYSSYTLQECYEKCATRDCEAFLYQSLPGMNGENAGGNLCKVYDECDMKPGTEGEFVFFPINNCIAEQWNGFSYKPANDGEKWYKKYDNLSTCLTRCDEGDMVTTGMEGDGNCYCWREDDGEFVRNTDDVVYQLADC